MASSRTFLKSLLDSTESKNNKIIRKNAETATQLVLNIDTNECNSEKARQEFISKDLKAYLGDSHVPDIDRFHDMTSSSMSTDKHYSSKRDSKDKKDHSKDKKDKKDKRDKRDKRDKKTRRRSCSRSPSYSPRRDRSSSPRSKSGQHSKYDGSSLSMSLKRDRDYHRRSLSPPCTKPMNNQPDAACCNTLRLCTDGVSTLSAISTDDPSAEILHLPLCVIKSLFPSHSTYPTIATLSHNAKLGIDAVKDHSVWILTTAEAQRLKQIYALTLLFKGRKKFGVQVDVEHSDWNDVVETMTACLNLETANQDQLMAARAELGNICRKFGITASVDSQPLCKPKIDVKAMNVFKR